MLYLPSPWFVYNLARSPFATADGTAGGQGDLSDDGTLIGRATLLRELVAKVRGATPCSSRQAIVGPAGIGKTAIVRRLKAALLEEGYLVANGAVAIAPGDPAQQIFGEVLGALYDAVLVHRPALLLHPAMRAARRVVYAERTDARLQPTGEHDPFSRFWAGVRKGTAAPSESDLLATGPRLMCDLVTLAKEAGTRGVLLHLRYHEHISEPSMVDAADVLRALYDAVLDSDGLHTVVVGSAETTSGIMAAAETLAATFSIHAVEELPVADVHAMLAARYARARLAHDRPTVPPVADTTVDHLHALFRGDLHGLLAALHDGVTPLLGVAGIRDHPDRAGHSPASPAPVRPLTVSELLPMLQARYAARLAGLPERYRVHQLTRWGMRDPTGVHTQRTLAKMWGASQAAVSNTMVLLVRKGFVLTLPRRAGEPTQYVLSGVSRLIFG